MTEHREKMPCTGSLPSNMSCNLREVRLPRVHEYFQPQGVVQGKVGQKLDFDQAFFQYPTHAGGISTTELGTVLF
jgi:hypothetical protein